MAEGMKSAPGWIRVLLMACVLGGGGAGFVVMRGCQDAKPQKPEPSGRVATVIAGKTFHLEPALYNSTRVRGLGGRTVIEPDGGMVFMFPFPQELSFVMRDCPAAIDIAFLDNAGKVIAMYEMPPEPPKRPDESMDAYEMRLKRYSSRAPCQLVVEVAGGTLRSLGVKEGDTFKLDIEGLKRRAR